MTVYSEDPPTNKLPPSNGIPLLAGSGLVTAVFPTIILFLGLNTLFFVPLVVGLGCFVAGLRTVPEPDNQRTTYLGLVLCLAAACGPFLWAAFLDRPGLPVRIVLPRDYRGEVRIMEVPEGGTVPVRGGERVFLIPEGGKLLVRSLGPLERPHVESIVFEDGTALKLYGHWTHAKSDDLAVFSKGMSGGDVPTVHFFVGTAKEAEAAGRP